MKSDIAYAKEARETLADPTRWVRFSTWSNIDNKDGLSRHCARGHLLVACGLTKEIWDACTGRRDSYGETERKQALEKLYQLGKKTDAILGKMGISDLMGKNDAEGAIHAKVLAYFDEGIERLEKEI